MNKIFDGTHGKFINLFEITNKQGKNICELLFEYSNKPTYDNAKLI